MIDRRWRSWAGALALSLMSGAAAQTPFLSPDAALCLQHLRPGERERAQAVLGPLESLPLYRVELEVDPDSATVQGRVEVEQWVGDHAISELYLQMTPNAQEADRVQLGAVTVNGHSAPVSELEPSLVRVPVSPPAAPGTLLRLSAAFRAHVPTVVDNPMGGLTAGGGQRERTDYGAFGASPHFLSLVGLIPRQPPLKPDGSPRDGPTGLGDLALYEPANLVLNVQVPRGYEVEATGLQLGNVPDGKGGVRYTFAAAVARDFPLFVSQGYRTQERRQGEVLVSVHFAPEHADAAARVLGYATSALHELERRFGRQPYTRFRVVEASLQSGAGGMEFPGLITVSKNLMSGGLGLLDGLGIPKEQLPMVKELVAATSSLEGVVENTLEFTVAHEVAHQYFALLVANDPITEPAVDETLAQYTALLYLEWKHGKEAAAAMRNGQVAASYHLYRMMGGEDGAVDRPTSAFGSGLEYAALVYGKGPLLHEAERQLMGDEAFVRGLRHYVEKYRYRWTCRDCLTQVLARESPGQASALRALRRRWWEEAHGDEDLGNLDKLIQGGGQGPTLDPQTQGLVDEVMRAFQ